MKRTALYLCVLLVLAAFSPAAHAEDPEVPTGKLMVVWTSADPDVAFHEPSELKSANTFVATSIASRTSGAPT